MEFDPMFPLIGKKNKYTGSHMSAQTSADVTAAEQGRGRVNKPEYNESPFPRLKKLKAHFLTR
jgi:hypothetical protein